MRSIDHRRQLERSAGNFGAYQQVAKLAETAIEYPPIQDPDTFNLDVVKQWIEAMIKHQRGQ